MTIEEHATEFAGKPVEDWDPDTGIADPTGTIYRIYLDYDESNQGLSWRNKFATFLDDPAASQITGLIVGDWQQWNTGPDESSAPIVEALVAARDRLPNLTALFLADIIREECEISWINQSDVAPLFLSYPALEHMRLRGDNGSLSLGSLRHDRLKSLVIEAGGLHAAVVQQVVTAHLPALEHLELWLGTEEYGGDATIDDVLPLLFAERFPKLRYLGLRNSEIADQIAFALAKAPILEQIAVLDLSLGTLGDVGAAALLESPAVRKLKKLDIHYHFCSPGVVASLQQLADEAGFELDASEAQEPDRFDGEESRFVAISE